MKQSISLIISIAFSLTMSSKLPTVTEKAAEELSKSSIPVQTVAVSEETTFDQTKAVDMEKIANTMDKDINFEEIYANFLSGQTAAIDKDGNHRSIGCYLDTDSQEDIKYAIYDMNGDAIPELIVKGRISLDIFWIYNNELTLWRSDAAYTKPLNNMALLYERAGGAPEHTDYMYIVLGYQGQELYRIDFSEYFNEKDPCVSYGNQYFINGTEVTKGIYDSLSERFLNISDDKIEWNTFSN